MGRILAIDGGTKRVGLAVTDPTQTIATRLDQIHRKDVISYLKNYFSEEEVDLVVIGEPRTLNNERSSSWQSCQQLAAEIRKNFPKLEVDRYDERFTTSLALSAMIEGGASRKTRREKGMTDQVSAVIILQSYMERRAINKERA